MFNWPKIETLGYVEGIVNISGSPSAEARIDKVC